jgi:hypothetical protein
VAETSKSPFFPSWLVVLSQLALLSPLSSFRLLKQRTEQPVEQSRELVGKDGCE